MNSIFELLSNQPHWEFEEKKLRLKSGEEKIVTVRIEKQGRRGTFKLDGQPYEISRLGFWQQRIMISKGDNPIVLLQHEFWGSGAHIKFKKGNDYELKIKNDPMVSLQFLDTSGRKVFDIRLVEEKERPAVALKVHYHHIPKIEMLFLFILGAFATYNILIENSSDHIINITAEKK